ncbi:hypothetical protein KAJ27_13120 [bacterium]|nr:hypothetical protein [bacterium]
MKKLTFLFIMLFICSCMAFTQTLDEVNWEVDDAEKEHQKLLDQVDGEYDDADGEVTDDSISNMLRNKYKVKKLEYDIKNLKEKQSILKKNSAENIKIDYPGIKNSDLKAVFDQIPVINTKTKAPLAKVMLLDDNIESWYARWYMITQAKKSIDIVYFALFDDAFGRAFMGLLQEKALQGVKVRFLVDNRGGLDTTIRLTSKDILIELAKTPNLDVKIYNPVFDKFLRIFTQGLKSVWTANHDKLVIIDGQWVMTGGRNIWSHFFADYKDDDKGYLDTDVLIKTVKGNDIGLAATKAFEDEYFMKQSKDLKPSFIDRFGAKTLKDKIEYARRTMEMYMIGDMSLLPSNENEAAYNEELSKYTVMKGGYMDFYKKIDRYFKSSSYNGVYPTKLLDKGSQFKTDNEITKHILNMMRASKEEIMIQNPYIILVPETRSVLIDAGQRGVKVNIFTASPTSTDELFVQGLFIEEWKDLFRDIPGVRIRVTEKRPLHSKVFIFDHQLVVAGTYNLDPLSQNMNSEVVAAVYSPKFSQIVRNSIEDRIKKYSVEYKLAISPDGREQVIYGPEDHCSKKILRKIKYFYRPVARMLRPLL